MKTRLLGRTYTPRRGKTTMREKLHIEVALTSIACAVDECARVIPAGDALYMRRVEGTACHEPICAVHAAEALEDMKLRARVRIHSAAQQRDELVPPPPVTLPRLGRAEPGAHAPTSLVGVRLI